ncbi:caspase, EACC1-associated type [Streptomyces anandii]|uniref:Caspase family protein n=1 Tax=Streptomyces anandii TaxID=285454 RepID=A0ABW6H6E2_9ACTN
MTDLAGAGVRVLLIATATHDGPTLPSVPSVTPTFHALRQALTERCGVPSAQLRAELDPPDAQAMAKAVAEEAGRADSVLLVYFVGHGLLDADGELYLAARGTDRLTPGLAGHQALSFAALRQALTASRAPSVVLILDCCFSGRPPLGRGTSVPAFSMDPAPGLYFIGSAEQLALAPPDAERTAFTGALVDVLTHGDPRAPRLLTLDLVHDAVFRTMRERQLPLPRRQAEGLTGSLVVAPNAAVPAVAPGDRTPPPGEPRAPGRCPYPGLKPFGPDDARLFRGRDHMVERLLATLDTPPDSPAGAGPWVLVGPSGSGKSSLLNAGLAHRLRHGVSPEAGDEAEPDSTAGADGAGRPARRAVLRLTPGAWPLRRLAVRLGMASEEAELLRARPEEAADAAARLLDGRPGQRLVLLVDQLEELFTLCPEEEQRTAFLRALTALATPVGEGPARASVVLALRADFYDRAAAHPDLLAALRDRQVLVEPMTAAELRAAIEQPAATTGLELDDGLADLVLHELGAADGGHPAAGALPLLSHALWATWRQGTGARLTFADYRAAGGIGQAIARTADELHDALDTEGGKTLRHILTRLVRVADDSADTAQPVERATLLHGLPEDTARQVLDRLTEARLVTLDQDTARLSHEALIRAWPRLREWVDADRDWLRDRQQLTDDAAAWERSGRDPSLLYRGRRLAGVQGRAEEASVRTQDLDRLPAEFMAASAHQQRRGTRRRRTAVAFLAVLALLASAGLAGSVIFQRQAEQAHRRDLARYLSAEAETLRAAEPGLAKQLSLLAYDTDHEAGRSALLNSRRTPGVINEQAPARDLATDGSGRVLAISTGDSVVLRFDGGSARIAADTVGPIALSRDGATLAAVTYGSDASTTATVRLWDTSRPNRPRQTAALRTDHTATALALGGDGKTLYAGLSTGEIRVWDIGDRSAPAALPSLRGLSERVDSLALSPWHDLLAGMSVDGRILLWTMTDPRRPRQSEALQGAPYDSASPDGPLHRVAFDRTGRLLAAPVVVARTEQSLGLWRLDTPGAPRRIHREGDSGQFVSGECLTSPLTSLAFSPAHQHVVGLCGYKWQAWVYATEPDTGLLFAGASMSLRSTSTAPGTVLFDPGMTRRVLVTSDRGVLVWYLSNVAEPGASGFLPLTPGTGAQLVYKAARGRQLIAVQGVGRNYLVDATELGNPSGGAKVLADTPAPDMLTGQDIALSADGRLLADVELYKDGKKPKTEYVGVRLRDTAKASGSPLATVGDELRNGVAVLRFSPAKPLLAVSDMNGWVDKNHSPPTLRLYDIADPRHPRQIAHIKKTVTELAFSPDGRTMILTDSPLRKPKGPGLGYGTRLEGWDVSDPAHPSRLWSRPLTKNAQFAYLAFRPDGRLLAVYQSNGQLRLWRMERGRPTRSLADMPIGDTGSRIAFSPDGTRLALINQKYDENSQDEASHPEIWDLRQPADPVRDSYLSGGRVSGFPALAFSPDGRRLAVLRDGAGVGLWDLGPAPLYDDLCRSTGDPISRQQWSRYLSGHPYRPPCR